MNQRRADFELLQAFARAGDQKAFADVIRRHLDLVYASALRKVGDAGAAEEIAQNVFAVLARKAWRFAPDDSLPAWLHRTTLLESQSWLRGELRRRRREQTAAELGTTMKTPDEQYAFRALVPLLDEALLSLREKDRTALLLRFYDNHSLRDVGAALGVGEDAAQKRVAGAVEKLAQFFQRRGFKTATLAATLAALRGTAASASAATVSSVTKVALQTAPPTFAGLFALVASFAGFTRIQKATGFLTVATLIVIWLWNAKPKTQADSLPMQSTVAPPSQTESKTSREPFFRPVEVVWSNEQVAESLEAQRYVEISADIQEFSYPSGDTNNPVNAGQDFSVVCVMGTKEWRIDPSFTQTGTSQWFFDGTNIYNNLIAVGGPRQIGASWKPRPGEIVPSITNSSVHIRQSRDGCPQDHTRLNIPWLAFCSGTYLKRPGRVIPLPVAFSLLHAPDALAYSDKTDTFDDDLGLPRTVDLFASDALFAASVTNGFFLGKHDVEVWKRGSTGFKWEFPDGALRFHYAVTESTNFLGWNFPVEFEWFLNNWETGKAVTRCGGKGKVTSIRASERPASVIVPGATNQNIVDWRFQTGNNLFALTYRTTNSFALPTNDSVLQEKLARKK